MAVALAKHTFTTGEISPAMLGRQDVERYASAGTTVRNFFIDYVGGLKSRAGTKFVGYSKQTGRAMPPKLIPFQFANNQALVLEFGNRYMRVISEGAFVTEGEIGISNVALTNPAQVTIDDVIGAATATPVNTSVISSYAPGDTVTLAGGTFVTPAKVAVTNTLVVSAYATADGVGYAPTDTITFAGGTHSVAAIATVASTQMVTPAASLGIAAAGSSGTPGSAIVTGTTGTGTLFQAAVTINGGGQLVSVDSIVFEGAYTVNPTTLSNEPVTGGGLSGAALSGLTMGVRTVTIGTAGVYTVNPSANTLTQGSTSGGGSGAVFNATFAPNSVTVSNPGQYSSLPANPASQASTSGTGVGAEFTLSSMPVLPPVAVGDWIFISQVGGTVELNNETFVIATLVGNVATLEDVFGNPIDATGFSAYTSGGFVSRIFTLTTIYSDADIKWLKVVQSADTMSICCLNQDTDVEYPPQDLSRNSDTDWTFAPVIPAPSVLPPPSASGTATSGGSVNYEYVVTSINPADGTESIASPIAKISNAVDIASTAGSITISWPPVAGVGEYFVYKALPGYGTPVAAGAQFGFAGFALGTTFVDSNITPDFSQSPPTHRNPFGRGVIFGVKPVALGAGYTVAAMTINTSTGSGAVLSAIISNGQITGGIVLDEGIGYLPGDTITITGDGAGAVSTLIVGPESGTYPSVPAYFQERRGYANTINNPDTYFFSQPGAFENFDTRNPTIASDAITGSPWAVQVNGVQWMIQTSGGLLVMTGLRAWMLVGAGSFATNVQPISPSQQNNVPQAFSGASAQIQPLLVNYDVVYVDPNGVYYFDLPYQLYALSEPVDLTDVSAHLFTGYTVVANAYCEKPSRIVWSARSDGVLLSMTFYKTQKVQGWARHDTQGIFVDCCSIIEPPVNALYLATQRFPSAGAPFMIERMDNRIWADAEDVWAVDCGLTYPQPEPAALLSVTANTEFGLGAITGVTGLVGGEHYSAATFGTVSDLALDANGQPIGSGAVPTLTIVAGVITAITFAGGSQGINYQQPLLTISDPAGSAGGSGASANLVVDDSVSLVTTPGVFSGGDVGSVIRGGGGIIRVTAVASSTSATGNVLSPLTNAIPNAFGELFTIASGAWTMTKPITVVTGLRHLANIDVTGLADGNVFDATVSADGEVTLATPASAITIGLRYQAQFQDVPLDMGNPTVQGQRKKIEAATVRLEASRGVKGGTNQRDGSSMSPQQTVVPWSNMKNFPDAGAGAPNFPPVPPNALCIPLRTGDVRIAMSGGLVTPGQVCIQQDDPLPCNISALYYEVLPGDSPQLQAPQKGQRGGGGGGNG